MFVCLGTSAGLHQFSRSIWVFLHLCLSSFLFMYPSDPAKSYIRKLGKAKCSNKSTPFKRERHHSDSRPLALTEYVKWLTNECFRHFLSSIFFAELYKCVVVNYFSVIRLIAWLLLTVTSAKCCLSSLGRRLGLEQKGAETPADHWQRGVWR